MDECWEQRNTILEKIKKFIFLINGDAENDVTTFVSKDHSLDEYKQYVIKYQDIFLAVSIIRTSSTVVLGVIKVDSTEIINVLCRQANKFRDIIIARVKSAYVAIKEK